MVVISHKHKFIVFKTYKTASTTIENFLALVLRENLNPEDYIIGSHTLKNGKIINKHITPDELFILMPEIKDYYKICSIRNPYTQIISCYIHNNRHIPNNNQLSDYIQRCSFNPETFKSIKKQYQHLRTYYSYILSEEKECIDYFIKLETLGEDLLNLLKMFNIKKYNIDRIGNSRKTKIKYQIEDIYSPENIKLVQNIFSEELKIGDYTFPLIEY